MENKDKVTVMLTEYQTLKAEEKTIYSFEFTCISIWLTFLGVLVGMILNQLSNLYETVYTYSESLKMSFDEILISPIYFSENKQLLAFLIVVILPGVCSLFGIIWLDLTTRFVKEAHYIFILEEKIRRLAGDEEIIGWDHFVYEEGREQKGIIKINYLYYCVFLGILILCPVVVSIVFILYLEILHNLPTTNLFLLFFVLIEIFTFCMVYIYVKKILSYPKQKEEIIKTVL